MNKYIDIFAISAHGFYFTVYSILYCYSTLVLFLLAAFKDTYSLCVEMFPAS